MKTRLRIKAENPFLISQKKRLQMSLLLKIEAIVNLTLFGTVMTL